MLNIMKTVKKEFRLPRVMIVTPSLALVSARPISFGSPWYLWWREILRLRAMQNYWTVVSPTIVGA
jgi:hypothetical protein